MSCVNLNPLNTKEERQCSKCKEVKLLNNDNFPKDKSKNYGFGYSCYPCELIRGKTRTGKVREMLCNKCNNMLGQAGEGGDNIKIMETGIEYIRKHNSCIPEPMSV